MNDNQYNFLTLLVHGESKIGKSWLGDTTPAPRLILDAEGGIRFTPSRKVYWDPMRDGPPEHDGSWDTCVVRVKDYSTLNQTYMWLNQSPHPFKSITLDSIMEIQQKCMGEILEGGLSPGGNAMRIQDWGSLLVYVEDAVRRFRDLTEHPTHPIKAVIYICGTKPSDGVLRPLLQGAITLRLPYLLDGVGYLFSQIDASGVARRGLLLEPGFGSVAGNRFGGLLPQTVWDPNIDTIYNMLYPQPTEG